MAENRADGGGTNSFPAGRMVYTFAAPVARSTGGNIVDPVFGCGGIAKEDDDSREIPRNVTKSADLNLVPAFNFGFGISIDARYESQFHDSVNDGGGVVPVQSTKNSHSPPERIADQESDRNCFEIDFDTRSFQSHSHSVSSSSMENPLLGVSNPFMLLPVNGGGMYSNRRGKRLSATDREARVLRYREKRKKRKFEKKVRYASRKAYAEMRPRIKGRFAKRTEVMTVLDVDRWWFTTESSAKSYGVGEDYGVVPSL